MEITPSRIIGLTLSSYTCTIVHRPAECDYVIYDVSQNKINQSINQSMEMTTDMCLSVLWVGII